MPSLEVKDCKQRAVLWPATGRYDRYSNPILGEPVDVRVRWVNKKREVTDAQGNNISLDATVVVLREVPTHSLMWLAPNSRTNALEQWYGRTGTGSAENDTELMCVVMQDDSTDIKNRATRRTVGMQRYSSKKPSST